MNENLKNGFWRQEYGNIIYGKFHTIKRVLKADGEQLQILAVDYVDLVEHR